MQDGERAWRERGLLSAVLVGDEQAWRKWYEESYAGLHAFVGWRCLGLRDLAEETVQETWLTAVRRIRHFVPEEGSFAGWLRGIACNVLRNHFRREHRRGTKLVTLNGQAETAAPPGSASDQPERAERTAHTLALLPEHYEGVLRAKYFEQQSVQAIADRQGESAKAIESLLTRARQAFRDLYLKLEQHHE